MADSWIDEDGRAHACLLYHADIAGLLNHADIAGLLNHADIAGLLYHGDIAGLLYHGDIAGLFLLIISCSCQSKQHVIVPKWLSHCDVIITRGARPVTS